MFDTMGCGNAWCKNNDSIELYTPQRTSPSHYLIMTYCNDKTTIIIIIFISCIQLSARA